MNDPNENRPGYKKTQVGWIPSNWRLTKIGEVRSYLGSGISRPFFDDPSSGGVPVLRSNNVRAGQVETDDIKYWHDPDPRGANLDAVKPRNGDILINFVNGSRKELGKAGVFRGRPKGCIVSTNFFIFRPDPLKASSDFLAYHFSGECYRKWLHRTVGFSGPGSFNQQQIASHPIPLPPLPEQQKIAEILSTWDDAIEQAGTLIAAKRQQKKALMQQLLTGHRRLPGFAEEWEMRRLGDVFVERCETGGERLALLAITGQRGIIPASEIDRKDASNEDKSKYKIIRVGDLGYNTMRMWQGVNAISCLEGIVSPAYTVATPRNCLHGPFLIHYFKLPQVVYQFYRYSQGLVSDTWNLKFRHFAEIRLHFPPLEEQRAIAAVLETADKELISLEEKLEALRQQKKGLMQRLLTGQVRVKT